MAASPRRRAWLLAVAAVLTGLALLPSVQARGKAIAVLVEAVGGSFPQPFAPDVERREVVLGGVTGHLYVPDRRAPALLLVLGAAPRGKDDPRAVRLAGSLARAGRVVFVPDLTLADQRFEEADLDRIARSLVALADGTTGRVAMVGISYGGSFALVTAADPRVRGRVEQVAAFGAYYDLVGVIQAVTTGVSLVGDRRVAWRPHPLARALMEHHALSLAPARQRDALEQALAGTGDPQALRPAARAIFELLANRDPKRTEDLASRLSPGARAVLDRFSPSTVSRELHASDVPIVAMHSTDDPAVPYGEAVRLARALPEARLATVGSFRHVDFRREGPAGWVSVVADLWDAWRFASWVIGAQE